MQLSIYYAACPINTIYTPSFFQTTPTTLQTQDTMVLHNPNNWHWVDKNCIDWTRQYFQENLSGISAESKGGEVTAKIDKVSSVEGDVDVSQRKGRLISLFDVEIKLDFSGSNGKDNETSGTISIPEVAYDTEEDEYQFNIVISNDSFAKLPVKDLVIAQIVPELRKRLFKFKDDLLTDNGASIQHPADQVKSKLTLGNLNKHTESSAAKSTEGSAAAAAPKSSGSYNTTSIELTPTFNTSADQLYQTFLDPQRVAAWSRGPPQISDKEGSEFALFGGNVTGKIEKLVKNERIVQTWRLKEWKEGHYSTLDLEFKEGTSDTKLIVKWSGIPVGQEDVARGNFEEYYIKSIQVTFGFGAPL